MLVILRAFRRKVRLHYQAKWRVCLALIGQVRVEQSGKRANSLISLGTLLDSVNQGLLLEGEDTDTL
jgi:hypothetical protein